MNGYTGTVKKFFKIAPYSLKDDTDTNAGLIKASITSRFVTYEKGGAKPKVTVRYGETILTEGKDYTVSYKNISKVASREDGSKAPSYTVKGKGNFKDSLNPQTFTIEPQDIGRLSITAEDVTAATPNQNKGETVGKTGKGGYKSVPKITDRNGKALSGRTDFEKSYIFTDENGRQLDPKEQVEAGSVVTLTVRGTKNYNGEIKVSYRCSPRKKCGQGCRIVKKRCDQRILPEPVTLKKKDLIVKLNGVELTEDDYTIVSYVNNRKKGTAKVTIRGIGEYGGTKTINFTIKARKLAWFKTP